MDSLHLITLESDEEPERGREITARNSADQYEQDGIAEPRGFEDIKVIALDLNEDAITVPSEKFADVNENVNSKTNEIGTGVNLISSTEQETETEEECPFNYLPNEILHYIFDFLKPFDLSRVAGVCKAWQVHASDPTKWTTLAFKNSQTDVAEVCRVIDVMTCATELRLVGLTNLSDDDFRQICSTCLPTVKSLDIGFLSTLGRDSILAITEYLPKLEQLNLEGSSLNNIRITALIKLKSLTNLNISHCSALDDNHVQTIISNLPLLESVNIDGLADVSDTTIRKLWQYCGTWLKHLYVDGANLTDLAMEYVAHCTELRTFMLSFGDNLTDEGLAHIMTLKKLRQLKMRKCSGLSTEAIGRHFRENEALGQLTVFDMSECIEFNDIVVFAMADRCSNLQDLSLCWCWEISDLSLTAIVESCPALKRLDLTGLDKIKGHAFEHIPQKMPKLTDLDLRQCNEIDDELLRVVINKMQNLTAYNYYGRKFGIEPYELD